MGAKETTAELRCKLACQEFDLCLWLASLSPLPELRAAKALSGGLDRIPVWAKSTDEVKDFLR